MNIGKKIAELRRQRKWTQAELAQRLNVTDKAVSKWEQGAGCPEIYTVVDIARIFGVSTDYLLMDAPVNSVSEIKEEDVVADDGCMKTGETITARTHAEFLNILLGKKYKAYMKCGYYFDFNNLIWMIRLDGQETSSGWCNSLEDDGNKIVEDYIGLQSQRKDSHKEPAFNQRRYVFDIIDRGWGRRDYIFRGVFEFDRAEGNNDHRVWKKVSDRANFKELLRKAVHRL